MDDSVIFTAGTVVTLAEERGNAFAARDERFVAVGPLDELRRRYPRAEVVDLGDVTVVPGLNDAHMHLVTAAEDLLHVDLSHASAPTTDRALELLREAASRGAPDAWIRASRYDDGKMAGPPLSRALVDTVSAERPIIVVHVAGHWAVVNSRALALAEIDESSQAESGGGLGRDASGRLNGLVYERTLRRFERSGPDDDRPLIASSDTEQLLEGLDRAQRMFHAAGLTSVTDANLTPPELAFLGEARARGRLSLRVNALLQYDFLSEAQRLGREIPADSRLRIAGIKAMVDGAIGGRTCLLDEPFEGRPDDHGIQRLTRDELATVVRDVLGAGQRLCVHANGDRAIRLLISELDRAAPLCRPEARHRIEHCSLIDDRILADMRRLGLVAVPFAGYVHYHGRKLVDWYGEARVRRMFAHRSFIDAGVAVAGSSDFPCGPYEPLVGMQSCVTRESEDGAPVGTEQRITPREALELFTWRAAYTTGEEAVKGRIARGLYADFVVLGCDPLTTPTRRIAATPVLATYVGGRRVWSRAEQLSPG